MFLNIFQFFCRPQVVFVFGLIDFFIVLSFIVNPFKKNITPIFEIHFITFFCWICPNILVEWFHLSTEIKEEIRANLCTYSQQCTRSFHRSNFNIIVKGTIEGGYINNNNFLKRTCHCQMKYPALKSTTIYTDEF